MIKRLDSSTIDSLSRPLAKRSVVNLVIDRLKEAMLNKELKPGDYLPSENELTRNLGVGKTSVREAVKMLEAMGVVEIRQGHGMRIPLQPKSDALSPLVFQLILDFATAEHLIELRTIFEPAYALLAMRKAGEEDLIELREILASFEAKIKAGVQTADDDLRFHERMLECTHNPYIVRIGVTIHQLFKASVSKSMRSIPEVALRDHAAIFAAFAARDEEGLIRAIHRSFEGWERSLGVGGDEAERSNT